MGGNDLQLHGKAATAFPGQPCTPRPIHPRAVGSGSLLSPVAVSNPLCAALGLVSHLWQVEEQRFMQHILLLWE